MPRTTVGESNASRIGVVTEVAAGELLQSLQFGVNGGSAGEVGVEGGLLGVHRGFRYVVDDATMNALFNQEAKLFGDALRIKRYQKVVCICQT